MSEKPIFSKEQSEQLAMDIIAFCKKWGMWQDVQIFTGDKCYAHSYEEVCYKGLLGVEVRDETNPDECTEGLIQGDDGEYHYESFSNPEHLLDMTFEGPLYLLLNYGEYTVKKKELSSEAIQDIILNDEYIEFQLFDMVDFYMENREGWDPMEFDSYEEYLELIQYDEPDYDKHIFKNLPKEFSSQEEYQELLERARYSKEQSLKEFLLSDTDFGIKDEYYVAGDVAAHVINEFDTLLASYGLWYEMGFHWSLTAYREL